MGWILPQFALFSTKKTFARQIPASAPSWKLFLIFEHFSHLKQKGRGYHPPFLLI